MERKWTYTLTITVYRSCQETSAFAKSQGRPQGQAASGAVNGHVPRGSPAGRYSGTQCDNIVLYCGACDVFDGLCNVFQCNIMEDLVYMSHYVSLSQIFGRSTWMLLWVGGSEQSRRLYVQHSTEAGTLKSTQSQQTTIDCEMWYRLDVCVWLDVSVCQLRHKIGTYGPTQLQCQPKIYDPGSNKTAMIKNAKKALTSSNDQKSRQTWWPSKQLAKLWYRVDWGNPINQCISLPSRTCWKLRWRPDAKGTI